MNEWIKVTDRLPENEQRIFFTDGSNIFFGEYNEYEASIYWNIHSVIERSIDPNAYITHWMPCMELPKGN